LGDTLRFVLSRSAVLFTLLWFIFYNCRDNPWWDSFLFQLIFIPTQYTLEKARYCLLLFFLLLISCFSSISL
jgi:hypothetical protein